MNLLVDWCDYQTAKYAVMRWHYSRAMPAGKLVKLGVWEDERFIGCVLFGRGANNNIGKPYNLDQTKVSELVRIALRAHKTTVSRIGKVALSLLRCNSPGLRLIVSYADPMQEHVGGIYQAMNWIYVGSSQSQCELLIDGQFMHKRTGNSRYGSIKGVPKSEMLWKHKYLYPFDRAMRRQIESLAQPYPKRELQHAGD